MVREARFELAQDCSRQPLKLVRLPFRHSRTPVQRLILTYCIARSLFRQACLVSGIIIGKSKSVNIFILDIA